MIKQIENKEKHRNMEPIDEFRDFGKKLPYQEPPGFFDQISEKTLLQAKLKEQNRKKSLVLWRAVTVAASLSALAFLGYFIFEPEKSENHLVARKEQPVEQQIIKKHEIAKQSEVAEIKNVIPEGVTEKIVVKENNAEKIGDVLADLSDDELLQLAAMYKVDPFIEDAVQ